MAKILFTADNHLGARLVGVKERYGDFLRAFENVGEVALREHPEALVMGGDLFDSTRPDGECVLAAQRVIDKVWSGGVQVYGIDGNHDYADGSWLLAVKSRLLTEQPTYIGGKRFIGVNYRNGADFLETLTTMADMGVQADVLVCHIALAEMNGGGGMADASVVELTPILRKIGVKLVLMGHVHIPDVRDFNGITYVSPGSTEVKSLGEPEKKYVMSIDLDTNEVEEIPLKTRKQIEVELATEEDLEKFLGSLTPLDAGTVDSAPMYRIRASAALDEAYKRLSKAVKDNGLIAKVEVRALGESEQVRQVVERQAGLVTLESAVEQFFPKDSVEAGLVMDMLRSPETSRVREIAVGFVEGENS